MELQYAENASLSLDLLIVIRTLQQILSRKKDEAALRTSQNILTRHVQISLVRDKPSREERAAHFGPQSVRTPE